jgi:hypothetical protein
MAMASEAHDPLSFLDDLTDKMLADPFCCLEPPFSDDTSRLQTLPDQNSTATTALGTGSRARRDHTMRIQSVGPTTAQHVCLDRKIPQRYPCHERCSAVCPVLHAFDHHLPAGWTHASPGSVVLGQELLHTWRIS